MLDFSEVSPDLIGGIEGIQSRVVYPDYERDRGIEGMVTVRFVVEPTGVVCGAEVARSVSLGLDREALDAVRQSRFMPGRQNGAPVAVRHSLLVRST